MVFYITFIYVGFIPWQKCCNWNKLFPCILWNFIVLSLVLSWWKIKYVIKINAVSWLAHKKLVSKGTHEKATCEAHDYKLKSHDSLSFSEYFARKVISQGTWETLYLAKIKCDFSTLHSYYIYLH